MSDTRPPRRQFFHHSARLAAVTALPSLAGAARAAATGPRAIALAHTHTGEELEIVYARGAHYLPEALNSLNHFLRDHYTGDVGTMDATLFDLLHRVQQTLGRREAFEVISGYRCPTTNARLRNTRGGGVATRSLHMDGRAIDVRLPSVALSQLRDAALSLQGGGVGYYPRSQFVHLDTGRVRRW